MRDLRLAIRFIVALVSLALGSSAWAALLPVTNANFENPSLGPGAFTPYGNDPGVQNIPGWTAPGDWDGVQNASTSYGTAPDGFNFAYDDGGTISQALSSNLAAGSYTLTVAVGHRGGRTFGGGELELFAGSTLLNSFPLTSPTAGTFADEQLTYNAGATDPYLGQSLKIALVSNGSGYSSSPTVDFDNVRLDFDAAPEPSTWALVLGSGAFLVALRRFRRGTL